ncbi:MAG: hypothetical protein JW937_08970 [Candidatus Omnitrophica bacterium]|nr:hypothetical protein [Candidatus Omnitrophota bacterium]
MKIGQVLLIVVLGVASGAAGGYFVQQKLNAEISAPVPVAEKFIQSTKLPEWQLVDGAGEVRAHMRMSGGDPVLVLYDRNSTMRAALSIDSKGEPALFIQGNEGVTQGVFGMNMNGQPILKLADKAGEPRIGFRLSDEGAPSLELLDAGGQPRTVLNVDPTGMPGIYLLDEAGEVVWSALPMEKE